MFLAISGGSYMNILKVKFLISALLLAAVMFHDRKGDPRFDSSTLLMNDNMLRHAIAGYITYMSSRQITS